MSKKNGASVETNQEHHCSIKQDLIDLLSPIKKAWNHRPDSKVDAGTKAFLGSSAKFLYNLLEVGRVSPTGEVIIPSVKDYCDDTRFKLAELESKYHGDKERMKTDKSYPNIIFFGNVNMQKMKCYTELFEAYCHVYKEFTGEDWVPDPKKKEETNKDTSDLNAMSESLRNFLTGSMNVEAGP